MVCRLIDFALVVLKLLMFTVCGIIGRGAFRGGDLMTCHHLFPDMTL